MFMKNHYLLQRIYFYEFFFFTLTHIAIIYSSFFTICFHIELISILGLLKMLLQPNI